MTTSHIDAPDEVLTEEQAIEVYTAIVAGLSRNYGYDTVEGEALEVHPIVEQGGGTPWPIGPVLCRNFESWSTDNAWAIVWEGGPFEWALLYPGGGVSDEFASEGYTFTIKPIELPSWVHTEAINSYSISLYLDGGPIVVPQEVQGR